MNPLRGALAIATFAVLALTSQSASAQDADAANNHPLKIRATTPVVVPTFGGEPSMVALKSIGQLEGAFQVVFRVTAAGSAKIAATTFTTPDCKGCLGRGIGLVSGWQAWNPGRGGRCVLRDSRFGGMAFSLDPKAWRNGGYFDRSDFEVSPTLISPNRPTFVSADFECNQPVVPGDRLSIEARFFVRGDQGWMPVDIALEDQVVGQ